MASPLLNYKVILHIDRVAVYNSPPSNSYCSYESEISGIPDDESEMEWPILHRFSWTLGVPDDSPIHQRQSVHDRLGEQGVTAPRLVVVGAGAVVVSATSACDSSRRRVSRAFAVLVAEVKRQLAEGPAAMSGGSSLPVRCWRQGSSKQQPVRTTPWGR